MRCMLPYYKAAYEIYEVTFNVLFKFRMQSLRSQLWTYLQKRIKSLT
jgi:hypothetical protein